MHFLIYSLCCASIGFLFLLPKGRPSFIPSDFFLARASLIRCEINVRSISADKPNAIMDHKVCPAFCVYLKIFLVPGIFEKIGNRVFVVFFAFRFINFG